MNLASLLEAYQALENEDKYLAIMAEVERLGSFDVLKNELEPNLLTFYMGLNLIGNWQSEGFYFLFAEGYRLLPYLSSTLEALELFDLKKEFDACLTWLGAYFMEKRLVFLDFSKPIDEAKHYKFINFLSNPRFTLSHPVLTKIPKDERKEVCQAYKKHLARLDEIAERYFGYDTEENGFFVLTDFLNRLEATQKPHKETKGKR